MLKRISTNENVTMLKGYQHKTDVMVIVLGNGHGDLSSNPERE